eukprot:CAMPEP_0170558880 /NCGR_PEP_ID=MMETSP0211-20121228/38574_1 /TAXON_ID=311385 /ORGANISM="Pseudokeronopsis sp., Strain OXSARD2" /LENGTH=70 /DNA_ID=CAMNT_0010871281 /DNA_START=70 /DNA_END=282 /DNA_ORIENTATION=+
MEPDRQNNRKLVVPPTSYILTRSTSKCYLHLLPEDLKSKKRKKDFHFDNESSPQQMLLNDLALKAKQYQQ